jgi:hypothetical protein
MKKRAQQVAPLIEAPGFTKNNSLAKKTFQNNTLAYFLQQWRQKCNKKIL